MQDTAAPEKIRKAADLNGTSIDVAPEGIVPMSDGRVCVSLMKNEEAFRQLSERFDMFNSMPQTLFLHLSDKFLRVIGADGLH